MGDAGVEVIEDALHDRRQLPLRDLDKVVAEHAGRRRRRGFATPSTNTWATANSLRSGVATRLLSFPQPRRHLTSGSGGSLP